MTATHYSLIWMKYYNCCHDNCGSKFVENSNLGKQWDSLLWRDLETYLYGGKVICERLRGRESDTRPFVSLWTTAIVQLVTPSEWAKRQGFAFFKAGVLCGFKISPCKTLAGWDIYREHLDSVVTGVVPERRLQWRNLACSPCQKPAYHSTFIFWLQSNTGSDR